jgi:kynureninase
MKPDEASGAFAQKMDKNDALKDFRSFFYFKDEETIYLDGNSLGRLPLKTRELISKAVNEQWGSQLIESWNRNWYHKPAELGDKIAKLTGAAPGEVIVCDNTSANLYKLAYAALKLQTGKTRIVSDVFNFPTDLYILQGLINDFGNRHELVLARSTDNITINSDDLYEKTDDNTALVVLSLVAFKSSFLYNALEVNRMAHKKGALVLWDLSHAAGAVEVELNKSGADLAVGCTYKYLNGGPGSPAFLYVRTNLQEKLANPIQGWFGDNNPFSFGLKYQPSKGIKKFLTGTPPILSLLAIEPGIDMLLQAGIQKITEKSRRQTSYFISLSKSLVPFGFTAGYPQEPEYRGSHVSLKHQEGYRITQALINPGKSTPRIIPDFREPDNIRFGITPLYTTYTELWQTIQRLREIVVTREYEYFSQVKNAVT